MVASVASGTVKVVKKPIREFTYSTVHVTDGLNSSFCTTIF